MEKQLTEMTTQELWKLFPIILKAYNPRYKNWYAQQAEELLNVPAHKDIYRMNHIGSTAVDGLAAKPTVDILLEMNRGYDMERLRKMLEENGWIYMSGEFQPECRLVFNKGYTPQGFAEKVFHLHVRYAGDWDELYFRDYLMAHNDAAHAYELLKKRLCAEFKHDRDAYTQAKGAFIRAATEQARREMPGKYIPL